MLHAHFSACNIEQLDLPEDKTTNFFLVLFNIVATVTDVITFRGGIIIIITLARISASSNSIPSCMEEGLPLLCIKLKITTYQFAWESTTTVRNNCHSFTKTILETGTITNSLVLLLGFLHAAWYIQVQH